MIFARLLKGLRRCLSTAPSPSRIGEYEDAQQALALLLLALILNFVKKKPGKYFTSYVVAGNDTSNINR
jgi:hypothetical protein